MHSQENHSKVEDFITAVVPLKWNHLKPWDRHGLILIVAGFVYIMIGTAFVLYKETQIGNASINLFPNGYWYIGFIVTGIASVISSRWPSRPRTLGYAVLTGWTAATAALYLISGIMDQRLGFTAMGLVWALVAFLWWAVSGLICPPKERGRNVGVPSPHRDRVGGLDRRDHSHSDTAHSVEGYQERKAGIEKS